MKQSETIMLLSLAIVSLATLPFSMAADIQGDYDIEWQYTCTGANTLYKNATIYAPTETIEMNQTLYCDYGCGTNAFGRASCSQPAYVRQMMLAAIVAFIIFAGIQLVRRIR